MKLVRGVRQSRLRAVHHHGQQQRCDVRGIRVLETCTRCRRLRESSARVDRTASGGELSSRVRELNGERMRRSARDVRAQSFLGVGAPEAVLVGVTALIVFGPKGLADVVKNAGKALRAFQPAIKELQEVSTELKDTLGDQMGLKELEEIGRTAQQLSRGEMPTTLTSAMDDDTDEDIEEMRRRSAAQAWGNTPPTPAATTTEESGEDGEEALEDEDEGEGENENTSSSPDASLEESSSSSPAS